MRNQKSLDSLQLELHRARTGLVNFKSKALAVMASGVMSPEDFLVLNEAARVSADFQDSLTLNKMTVVLYNNQWFAN